MTIFIQGFLLQASLILALGAQNIFVLESGLKKQRHLLVATVCSICDLLLIFVGVLGAATFFIHVPALKFIFGLLGVGFLFFYGALKLKDYFSFTQARASSIEPKAQGASAKQMVLNTLGFSLLNPHVYLDTVILIGGFATQYSELTHRLQFGLGAGALSVLWFFSLAYFASLLGPYLQSEKNMKRVSLISGTILILLSIKLGLDVVRWF